jgi:hypothetical protein
MTNASSQNAKGRFSHWWIGPVSGALVSATVTVIVVIWEWIENPGGIFRSELGTNWKHVSDTAISWFVPTFANVAVIVAVSQLVWHFVRKYRGAFR